MQDSNLHQINGLIWLCMESHCRLKAQRASKQIHLVLIFGVECESSFDGYVVWTGVGRAVLSVVVYHHGEAVWAAISVEGRALPSNTRELHRGWNEVLTFRRQHRRCRRSRARCNAPDRSRSCRCSPWSASLEPAPTEIDQVLSTGCG